MRTRTTASCHHSQRVRDPWSKVTWTCAGPSGTAKACDHALPAGADVDGSVVAGPGAVRTAPGPATTLPSTSAPAGNAWSQAFAVPDGPAQVQVTFDQGSRTRWLWWQLAVVLVLIVLALPSRQPVDPDPDDDAGPEELVAPQHEREVRR